MKKRIAFLFLGLLSAVGAYAQTSYSLTAVVPTNWGVQYWVGSSPAGLYITNTGSTCSALGLNNYLQMPSTATEDDVKLLVQLITAAKIAGTAINVTYTMPKCYITWFGPN